VGLCVVVVRWWRWPPSLLGRSLIVLSLSLEIERDKENYEGGPGDKADYRHSVQPVLILLSWCRRYPATVRRLPG
jgi:hypothetical protein